MNPSETLGLIGVGLLGTALAERFQAAGLTVIGHDLDSAGQERLTLHGGQAVPTAAEVFYRCRRVVLCLPTTAEVEEVLAEAQAILRPGQVVLDLTTGDPERMMALGTDLFGRGVHYLDAPVAGSSTQARHGDVLVLVGGKLEVAESCDAIFAAFAREWFHVGPWGSGARMKLVLNLILGLNRAVLAEGLGLARASGLEMEGTLRILQASPAYSRVMDTKGRKMIDGDFEPQARLAQHAKDVRLILEQAARVKAQVPLSIVHAGLLEKLEKLGHGEEDNAAIFRAFD